MDSDVEKTALLPKSPDQPRRTALVPLVTDAVDLTPDIHLPKLERPQDYSSMLDWF